MKILRYDEIMQKAMQNVIARCDKVTDFNEGSIIHTILDTVARIAEREYVAIRQGYNEMLASIPYSAFRFYRREGQKSVGTVTFTATSVQVSSDDDSDDGVIIIPKGTIVSAGGLKFETCGVAKIQAGELKSQEVEAIAMEAGSKYNVAAAAITSIESAVPGVSGVTNPKPFTQGSDEETDAAFEERFKSYLSGLSGTNFYAIKQAVLSIAGIRSMAIQNHKPLLDNIYNLSIYVEDGTGYASLEMLQAVHNIIEGDGTKENPGHLAPGINAKIMSPTLKYIDLYADVLLLSTDEEVAKKEIEGVIINYINALSIAQPFLVSALTIKIMDLPYVKDVALHEVDKGAEIIDSATGQKSTPISESTALMKNVKIGASAIARAGIIRVVLG